jgi:CheY-like chemotaxis protein
MDSSLPNADSPFAVILDDNPDDGAGLKLAFERVLLQLFPVGSQRTVNLISTSDLLRGELGKNPDLALIDIDLPEEKVSGLELIDANRERYPHIVFVAVTGDSKKFMTISNVKGQPDILLPKTFLLGKRNAHNELFRKQLVEKCMRQNRDIRIEFPVTLERHLKDSIFGTDAGVLRRDIECLVRQVFLPELSRLASIESSVSPGGNFYSGRAPFDRVVLKEFLQEQGRSKSFVCIASAYDGDEKLHVDTILKFCPPENSRIELEKYEHFVKWMLPTQWRVDLLGRGRIQKLAVLGYSVAFDEASSSRTLADSIRENRYEEVAAFIDKFFSPLGKVWYKNVEKTNDGETLVDSLFDRYYRRDIASLNAAISSLVGRIGADLFELEVFSSAKSLSADLLTMIDRLRLDPLKGYTTCICHGDLHARNILVSSSGGEFAFVDYRDIDRLHALTDFVCLEVSIRIEDLAIQGSDADAHAELQLLANLGKGREVLPKDCSQWLKSVADIRALAFANFPGQISEREYLLHIWVFSLCRLLSNGASKKGTQRRIEVLFVLLTMKLKGNSTTPTN